MADVNFEVQVNVESSVDIGGGDVTATVEDASALPSAVHSTARLTPASGKNRARECLILTKKSGYKENCAKTITGKKRYCDTHEPRFQMLYRDLFPRSDLAAMGGRKKKGKEVSGKEVKKAKPKKTSRGKRKRNAANLDGSGEESSEAESDQQETEAQLAYREAFGDGRKDKGDLYKASVVLEEHIEAFPTVQNRQGIKGTAHSEFLKKYLHTKGARKADQAYKDRPMWDFEFFKNRLKWDRGWEEPACLVEWEELKKDPQFKSDNGGYKGAERRSIPSNLICTEGDRAVQENFEEKRYQESRKLDSEMSRADVDKTINDCSKGFGDVTQASSCDFHAEVALPSATMTDLGKKKSSEFMEEQRKKMETVESANSAEELTTTARPSPTKQKHITDEQMDVSVIRRKVCRDEEQAISKQKKDFWKALISAAIELKRNVDLESSGGGADVAELKERFELGLCYIGYENADIPSVSKDKTEVGTPINFASLVTSKPITGCTDALAYHNHLFQTMYKKLKLEGLPVETNEADATSFTALESLPSAIRKASSAAEIDQTKAILENRKTQMVQLKAAIDNMASVCKKDINKAEQARKLQSAEQKRKNDEQQAKAAAEARAELAKVAHSRRSTGFFGLGWVQNGGKNIQVLETDATLKEHWAKNPSVMQPFIHSKSEKLHEIFANPTDKSIGYYVDKYHAAWPMDDATKGKDESWGFCKPAHNCAAVDPYQSMVIPAQYLVDNDKLSSLMPHAMKWCFWGYSTTCLSCDFGASMIGSLRIVVSGQLSVLLIEGNGLADGLDQLGVPAPKGSTLASRLRTYLILNVNASELPLNLQRANIKTWSGYIDTSGGAKALLTPPGWFSVLGSANMSACSGLVQSFLPKGSEASKSFGSVTSLTGEDRTSMLTLMQS